MHEHTVRKHISTPYTIFTFQIYMFTTNAVHNTKFKSSKHIFEQAIVSNTEHTVKVQGKTTYNAHTS